MGIQAKIGKMKMGTIYVAIKSNIAVKCIQDMSCYCDSGSLVRQTLHIDGELYQVFGQFTGFSISGPKLLPEPLSDIVRKGAVDDRGLQWVSERLYTSQFEKLSLEF